MKEETAPAGFAEGLISVAGLTLRPFTLGTLDLCQELRLTLFTGTGDQEKLSIAAQARQLATYLWMQSGDLDARLASIESGAYKAEVRTFMFSIPPSAIEPAMQKIMAGIEAATAARVDVQPKPDDKPESAPPNS